jgi:hypothetical protein
MKVSEQSRLQIKIEKIKGNYENENSENFNWKGGRNM